MLTSFFGTITTLRTVLPARRSFIFGNASGRRFNFGVGCIERDSKLIAQLSIHLHDDFDFILDKETLVVTGPRLFGDVAAHVLELVIRASPTARK